jgi:hypothetical protein
MGVAPEASVVCTIPVAEFIVPDGGIKSTPALVVVPARQAT